MAASLLSPEALRPTKLSSASFATLIAAPWQPCLWLERGQWWRMSRSLGGEMEARGRDILSHAALSSAKRAQQSPTGIAARTRHTGDAQQTDMRAKRGAKHRHALVMLQDRHNTDPRSNRCPSRVPWQPSDKLTARGTSVKVCTRSQRDPGARLLTRCFLATSLLRWAHSRPVMVRQAPA